MKNTILKLALFSVFPLMIVAYAVYRLGENSDDFYRRFISPTQNSLILGSSRAASLDPETIQKTISKSFQEAKIYNYAFTWAHSPYGSKYLESIKKKLKPDAKNGVFIIAVEPTAVMVEKDKPDNEEFYVENDKSVAKTSCVSCNPNIEYLAESYDYSITQSLNIKVLPERDKIAETEILDNGRYKVKILKKISEDKRKKWNEDAMQKFSERMNSLKLSPNRLNYLEKTVELLQNHGYVILIRMPINEMPYKIENNNLAIFDENIQKIADRKRVKYINFNRYKNQYKWTDEVHLTSESMLVFSKVLADSILSSRGSL